MYGNFKGSCKSAQFSLCVSVFRRLIHTNVKKHETSREKKAALKQKQKERKKEKEIAEGTQMI